MDKNASDTMLWERSVEGLEAEQTLVAAELLLEFTDIFAENDLEMGCFEAMEHGIDTWGARPVGLRMRWTPSGFENEENQQLEKILTTGVIKPNQTSARASASVLVRKEDGGVRRCVDFLAVNQGARRDFCSLPLVESCIGALTGVEFVGTLVLRSVVGGLDWIQKTWKGLHSSLDVACLDILVCHLASAVTQRCFGGPLSLAAWL